MRYGLSNVDWEERWNPERMRKERLEKARKVMKGHGLDAHEPPHITFLSKKHPVAIKTNMVFAVETYVADEEDRQGVRLEENLIVTDKGYEIISKYPFDERLLD